MAKGSVQQLRGFLQCGRYHASASSFQKQEKVLPPRATGYVTDQTLLAVSFTVPLSEQGELPAGHDYWVHCMGYLAPAL